MKQGIQPTRLTAPRHAWLLLAATLLSGALLAGCGGSSTGAAASRATGVSTPASTAAGSTSTASHGRSGPLEYAECMRANGVPNFPDPAAGGGQVFRTPASINQAAPSFQAAQAKCQKLMDAGAVGGPIVAGAKTHPSPQTLMKLLKIAVCMRAHGVSQFPDPRTSIPSNPTPGEYQEITDFDGVILLFPATLDLQAPAYKQALATCSAPPLGLPH